MDISEIWHWVERIAGTFLVVCLGLYALRCIVAWDVVSFDQFVRSCADLSRTS
jgi:hypothetical protein